MCFFLVRSMVKYVNLTIFSRIYAWLMFLACKNLWHNSPAKTHVSAYSLAQPIFDRLSIILSPLLYLQVQLFWLLSYIVPQSKRNKHRTIKYWVASFVSSQVSHSWSCQRLDILKINNLNPTAQGKKFLTERNCPEIFVLKQYNLTKAKHIQISFGYKYVAQHNLLMYIRYISLNKQLNNWG